MSGICGLVYPSERRVDSRGIEAILEPLKRRGPDGSHTVIDGRAALGQASLVTTSEAQSEAMPFQHDGSGCIITADARLDHRQELGERLGLSDSGANKGDGELILLAYLTWGLACLEHIVGDFAFAIWDPRDHTMFCARDQVGMRQLIYTHQPNRLFAFATEPQALLQHLEISAEIDEGRIGDFLEDLEARDLTSTFFVGLHKLPPAHALVLDRDRLRKWQYWRAEPQETLKLPSNQAYAEAFSDVFTRAVKTRLRSNAPVGAMLSGGMDSSSVAATAARLLMQDGEAPLQTFSALSTNVDCVESNAIRAAMGIKHIDPTSILVEDIAANRDDLLRLTEELGEPFDAHMTLPRAVYLAAQKADVRVMLDGVGGDTTLGSEPMVAWYLKQGKFASAMREARGEARFWGGEADPWIEHAKSAVRAMVPQGWLAQRHARYVERKLERAASNSPLDPVFAQKIDMTKRRRENDAHVAQLTEYKARKLQHALHPYVTVGRERYDRTAAAMAIEPRDPFLDLNVIAFCQSLPQSQLQEAGWPKIILRRAMKGLIPGEVLWRKGKQHLGYDFTVALHQEAPSLLTPEKSECLQQFVKADVLKQALKTDQPSKRIEERIRLGYLQRWMKHVNTCN